MQISRRNLLNRKLTKRLQLFWFTPINKITKPKLSKDIESPCKDKAIRSKCHAMLPSTSHLNNLDPKKTSRDHLRHSLLIQLFERRFQTLRALAKLAKTIPAPAIKHIIMIISNRVMESCRNPFEFTSDIVWRIYECFEVALATFSLPIVSEKISISSRSLLVVFGNCVVEVLVK